ncbi:uncharacterized protein YciI [Scopulibacillus darangshiensis]|uniref:Uncharacterized protein YciI n=1 Tax=Scopulibacillus darangshiensis TaxID=442528 RepID=A0A4R2NVJ1_9BACL|nr:YciI family protein [Scopulibacillus darangshiensis]TCP25598.1 uncharacterized protein YciI [Scopulibacillus darangshiensis]
MFIVLLKYIKPLSAVDEFIQEHTEFLDKHYKRKEIVFSGRREPRTGGIMLVNLNDADAVKEMIAEDPFYKNDIAEYDIIKFTPTKYDEAFSSFINN